MNGSEEGWLEERGVWGVFGARQTKLFIPGPHIPGSLRPAATQPVISNPINIIIIALPSRRRHTNLCLQSHSIVLVIIVLMRMMAKQWSWSS